ncbi:MAG: hypothetical protein J6I84_02535 [Bacilli bacterium]|nr:hypothetical protein [Bacilli bacterium]
MLQSSYRCRVDLFPELRQLNILVYLGNRVKGDRTRKVTIELSSPSYRRKSKGIPPPKDKYVLSLGYVMKDKRFPRTMSRSVLVDFIKRAFERKDGMRERALEIVYSVDPSPIDI